MFDLFRRDLARCFSIESNDGNPALFEKLQILASVPQLQAIGVFRFGSWLIQKDPVPKPVSYPLKAAYYLVERAMRILWGIQIHPGAQIGAGFYIGHPGAIIVGPVKMGADCSISERVTLGVRTDGQGLGGGLPTFGDCVWVGAGSVVFGKIHIGSGVTIGPLTVVGRNVPPRAMVIGNPMQVLKTDHDNTTANYGAHPLPDAIVVPPRKAAVAELDDLAKKRGSG